MATFQLFLTATVSIFWLCGATPAAITGATVTIDSGVVIGTATSFLGASVSVNKFLGIPFAASPTRFSEAARPTPWQEPLDASKYGPACIQQFNYPEAARDQNIAFFDTPPPAGGESEDCLNLNIYMPASPTLDKTVMVWIYVCTLNLQRLYSHNSRAVH